MSRDLTDAQWAILEAIIRRTVLDGILWVLRTGAPWADVPDRYPSYQICHRRFQQWVRSGVMRGILEALALELKVRGVLDVEETFIDGSFASAKRSKVGKEVSRGGPGFSVTRMRTQPAMLDAQTVRERLLATLALFFAGVALLLAAVGLYGVLDYSVFQRCREIAIRMAMGAQGRTIIRLVMTRTFFFMFTGAIAGVVLSLISIQYVKTLLYEVSPTDWGMITLPFVMLVAAGLFTAVPTVVRAVQVDPANLLRAE